MVKQKKVVKKKVPKKKVSKKKVLKKAPKKEVSEKKKLGKKIGEVSNYFEHVKVAAVKLTAPLKVGDRVRFKGGEVDFEQDVGSMQVQHDKVEKAKKGDEIGMKVKKKVRKGYHVFKL